MLLYLIILIALKILGIENIQRNYMRAIGETGCIVPERAAGTLLPQKGRDGLSHCIEMGRHRLGTGSAQDPQAMRTNTGPRGDTARLVFSLALRD